MIEFNEPFLKPGEKLVCFGDSITEQGYYVDELQKILPNNTVVNAGRGGDKTPWALTRFQQDAIDSKPDALLIALGTNDSVIGRAIWADEPQVSEEAYYCNLVWMAYLAHNAGIRKIAFCTPMGCREGKDYALFGDIMRNYCLKARDAASVSGCRLVAWDSFFWGTRPDVPITEIVLTQDGVHPTEDTARNLAHFIAKELGLES